MVSYCLKYGRVLICDATRMPRANFTLWTLLNSEPQFSFIRHYFKKFHKPLIDCTCRPCQSHPDDFFPPRRFRSGSQPEPSRTCAASHPSRVRRRGACRSVSPGRVFFPGSKMMARDRRGPAGSSDPRGFGRPDAGRTGRLGGGRKLLGFPGHVDLRLLAHRHHRHGHLGHAQSIWASCK